MNREQALNLFRNITVWKKGNQRAPNKPLLLLYAIGQLLNDRKQLPYSDIDEPLRNLLREFGPSRKTIHTEYPFWRLKNDLFEGEAIWILSNHENAELRSGNTDAKKSELKRLRVCGQLNPAISSLIKSDPNFLLEVCEVLLSENFPSTIHEDILNSCGISAISSISRPTRDPNFRKKVLTAYRNQCCICRIGVQVDSANIALEGAHIRWVQANGPNHVSNGLSLCPLHHKLFDRGAFTIAASMQIVVSERASGLRFKQVLGDFDKTEIQLPSTPSAYPDEKHLNWHYKEVFKQPH